MVKRRMPYTSTSCVTGRQKSINKVWRQISLAMKDQQAMLVHVRFDLLEGIWIFQGFLERKRADTFLATT